MRIKEGEKGAIDKKRLRVPGDGPKYGHWPKKAWAGKKGEPRKKSVVSREDLSEDIKGKRTTVSLGKRAKDRVSTGRPLASKKGGSQEKGRKKNRGRNWEGKKGEGVIQEGDGVGIGS